MLVLIALIVLVVLLGLIVLGELVPGGALSARRRREAGGAANLALAAADFHDVGPLQRS